MQPTYRYVEDSQKSNTNGSKRVTILHFNDIYDALPHYSADSMAKGELLGGASRFVYRTDPNLIENSHFFFYFLRKICNIIEAI